MGWSPSVAGEDASSSDTEEIDITEETRRVYEKNVERFKEEYRIIVGLKHPNVADVRKIGFFDGHLYDCVGEGKVMVERQPKSIDLYFLRKLSCKFPCA